ncbi:hypothetical protein SM007_33410 [Streptomyces avermitilis]|uniref:Secreted protein n=1 Tax=Streptomyces avermitilis TaxID=33903 RepID=A0A4D4MA51_STRAX|nr:hypothetical protein [Streptomyces avermitilis]OOV21688.1 hypothetical protein SM007_33410 [Streptomyces avermitilis]GDY68745.1 hypothetical protein SAV14893_081380 [Streptomyces avermitilis]GDY70874.1 hypothetical protein SAV31267_003590 [Streptomyces avermitilis]
MNRVKKVAAVGVMVGGMALGGGVAHASDDPADVILPNLQVVDCQQEFDGGAAFAPAQGAATDGNTRHIGNFCTVIAPVHD